MSSLGNDLASIRVQKQLSLEEVHVITKIPLATLKSIEDGSLFQDTSQQHQTYVRSFVRSFGKALKIDNDALVEALDQHEKGEYTTGFLLGQENVPAPIPLFELDDSGSTANNDQTNKETKVETSPSSDPKPYEATPAAPTVESVNWADMGKKFGDPEVKSRIWILGISIFLLVAVIVLGFIFRNTLFPSLASDGETPPTEITTPSNSSVPTQPESNEPNEVSDPVPPNASSNSNTPTIDSTIEAQELADTLTLVVYAAYDILDPVRITSDISGRTNPYWVEQGDAYSFSFQDTVFVRGQYSRLLLMLNGHIIEDFRNQYFDSESNSVMLTRSIFENDSKYIQPAPSEFPLEVGPPVQVINPPGF